MRAIVSGMIATYPVGGAAWDYAQYLAGLEQLGFETWYLEDAGVPTYDPRVGSYTDDPEYGVSFLAEALRTIVPSASDRWHVRAADGSVHGCAPEELAAAIADADVFLNVSGAALLRDDYMACTRKVLIDTDPGWNHFVNYPRWDAQPGWHGTHGYRAHDFFFTYAERIGRAGCLLPTFGLDWQPTRPPVLPGVWGAEPPGETWTTVMTWDNFRRPIEHEGVTYGTKEREFSHIETLPRHVRPPLEIAVGGDTAPRERWRELGWRVRDAAAVSATPADYRHYVQRSRGEFSVAKNVYVATRSGWSSCRSVCYLAAGRPVVVQDTGFSEIVPVGDGLLPFATLEEAAAAICSVERDYDHHARAARQLAEDEFSAGVVLGALLERIGLG